MGWKVRHHGEIIGDMLLSTAGRAVYTCHRDGLGGMAPAVTTPRMSAVAQLTLPAQTRQASLGCGYRGPCLVRGRDFDVLAILGAEG